MAAVSAYIDELVGGGRYHFTSAEAHRVLKGSHSAVVQALRRLKRKGVLATPQRGFYVIVPPEYRSLGCLPPDHFVHQLMEYMEEPYYVGLLSAAEIHGAAHQRPQVYQVTVRKPRRAVRCGMVSVDFYVRGDIERASVVTTNTPRGYLRVSSPETTALDLVGNLGHAGGLDNVATVLAELAQFMDGEQLVVEARKAPLAWAQRLGYLLDLVEANEVADPLQLWVAGHADRVAPLQPSGGRTSAPRSERWRLAINADVEPDL